jgi:hypothetical protein
VIRHCSSTWASRYSLEKFVSPPTLKTPRWSTVPTRSAVTVTAPSWVVTLAYSALMTVMPVSSDHDPAASGARCSRATGWPATVLAAASMKLRTISSGVAPGTGDRGSIPTSSAGSAGAWVICTVGELAGTAEQAGTASSSTTSTAGSRTRPVTTAPRAAG